MNIGDIVKVFSSISDYDGQTGRIVHVAAVPGAPAPYVVQFGDAITEAFSERELVSMKPLESLWCDEPLQTFHAPHGAPKSVQRYVGRIIAQRFMSGERRRMLVRSVISLGSPCIQCGKVLCSHR